MRKYQTKKAETEGSRGATPGQPGSVQATEQFTKEAIEKLAYEYWLNRGCPAGSAEDDWYQAEQALQTTKQNSGDAASSMTQARRNRQGAAMRAGG